MTSKTYAAEIEAAAGDEPIIALAIGKYQGYGEDARARALPDDVLDRPLGWPEARPFLDYTYHHGFGTADCHPVIAWTETRIIFTREYDGSTSIEHMPRHPQALKVDFTYYCD